jgi:tRNA A-37 threonylcarbamoyl transferase component Bud32
VSELLQRWQELRAGGRRTARRGRRPGRPDLLDELKRHIQALASMEHFLGAAPERGHPCSDPAAGPQTAPEPTRAEPGCPPAESEVLSAQAQGPPEPSRLGDFRILRRLGAGGMGVVYLAEDTRLGRRVALKVLRPELAAQEVYRRRFLREARAAAAVRSDHVVTVYHVGEDGGAPYLAMELLPGRSLDAWLRAGHRPSPAEAARIGRQAAEGLAAAHARGLVHRDVKPGNLWLEDVAGGWRVKVLDFGLARLAAEGPLTQTGLVVGTPAYMAPEQAAGQAVDGRADLFSLGCVLYELCTGAQPFAAGDALAVLHRLATHTPLPPWQRNPAVPAALSDLVVRLLAKRPEDRPASAAAVAAELAQLECAPPAAASEATAVLAPPAGKDDGIPAVRPAAQRPARRRRWAVLAFLAVLAAVAGGVASRLGGPATGPDTPPASPPGPDENPPVVGPLPDRDKPFVLLREGKAVRDFKTLGAAVNELQAGDVVEVHGNGPFPWTVAELPKPLTLRAAAGYRPFFVVPQTVLVKDVSLLIEGCDFDARLDRESRLHESWFLDGGGDSWELRHCRMWVTNGIAYGGPRLCLADCLVVSQRGLAHLRPKAGLELTNCLVQTGGAAGTATIELCTPGNQTVRLGHSTLLGAWVVFRALPEGSTPATVEAVGNRFWLVEDLIGGAPSVQALQHCLRWKGRDNFYNCVGLFSMMQGNERVEHGLADWAGLKGNTEEGSRHEASPAPLECTRIAGLDLPELRQEMEPVLAEARARHRLPELGPDWEFVGPGAAYVKALEKQAGRPLPRDELRPEAAEGGPFVLHGPGKKERGFLTLQQAVNAAQDGDTVEIRTDGPFAGAQLEGKERRLTLRAAPGYIPTVAGPLVNQGTDRLILKGLTFRDDVQAALYNGDHRSYYNNDGRLLRLENCSFPAFKRLHGWFRGLDGEPVEVVNCRLGFLEVGLHDGGQIRLANSVLRGVAGQIPGNQGRISMVLDRCLVLRELGHESVVLQAPALHVTARRTYFAAVDALWYQLRPGLPEWQGAGNLYRGSLKPLYGENAYYLSDLQGVLKTDTDSVEEPPLLWDPRQWRLPPAGPGLPPDNGADVRRILGP